MTLPRPGSAYRLMSVVLLPLWLFHALWHGYRQHLPAYLSLRVRGKPARSPGPAVWVHAASVGEVEAASALVKALLDRGEAILFTSFTATGYQTIRRNFAEAIDAARVEASVIPVDFAPFCRGFLRRYDIKLCLLMETELWPELLWQTAHRGISIIQLNARLSRKSLGAPPLIRNILKRTLGYISLHLVRNDQDRDRLLQLGAAQQKIKIVGNLKSAIEASPDYPRLVERDYLLLASSHDGEEGLLLGHRPASSQGILIVIAPRHPTRAKAIQRLLSESGLSYATRSLGETIGPETAVYLADTLGELKALMAHARIVVMGGSFDQSGGHNLIEPAALGCVIITGPSDDNIREDIALISQTGTDIQVADMAACQQKIEYWLENPDQAKLFGQRVKQAIRQKTGVLQDYMAEIKPWL